MPLGKVLVVDFCIDRGLMMSERFKRGYQTHNQRLAILQRRVEVSQMYCSGKPLVEIALHFGVSMQTVSKDLCTIRKEWMRSAKESFADAKNREVAKLDHLEATAWESFVKSTGVKATIKTRTSSNRPYVTHKERTIRFSAGNEKFLEIVQRCIETRLKVLGAFPKGENANEVNLTLNWQELYVRDTEAPDEIERLIEQAGTGMDASAGTPRLGQPPDDRITVIGDESKDEG
jgi:hypothetical protein